jgi:hypothetical protein
MTLHSLNSGMVCVSLTLLGILLTVLEFHRMSPSENAIAQRPDRRASFRGDATAETLSE